MKNFMIVPVLTLGVATFVNMALWLGAESQLKDANKRVDRAIAVAEDWERLATTSGNQRDEALTLLRQCAAH